ncbi:ABC transporter permease subunit [bacterium]|nr:ABC transporter permease subunit [bacterium]
MYDPPVRWAPDYSAYIPGSLRSWEYNEDGIQLTLNWRQGIKWSDGEPFTTADLQFAWEDLMTNEEYSALTPPGYLRNDDGSPADVTFPDDYTMVVQWDKPQWLAHTIMAQGYWEWERFMYPEHYLSQFHPTYSADGGYAVLEENSVWFENPDFPTIFAWHLSEFTPSQTWKFERNPYYWKTDPKGNQLPYIDYLEFELVEDSEVRLLNTSQGQYDATFRGVENFTDIPFLLESAEAGDFRVINYAQGNGAEPNWMVNQSYRGNGEPEEVVAEIRTLLLAFVRWGGTTRQVRGLVLSLREREYVLAARSFGVGDRAILFRHLIPGTLSHVIVTGDEPTTALDVTTQAQINDLMRDLQAEFGMSIIYIPHDLGVIAEVADRVAVMYLGRIVEQADVETIFYAPKHPCTRALLHSIPKIGDGRQARLNTIIGAASTTFGPKVLRDIRNHPGMGGSTFHFVDINEERLAVYDKLARRFNHFTDTPVTIRSSTDRNELLPGSDYVILSVDTGHYSTWRQDFETPIKHGIRQIYGELGGPGGIFHSLRQIPLHLDIAANIAQHCPNAKVLAASNPLNRICLAMQRHSGVGQIVGLCHGVEMALYLYLNKVLGIDGDDMEAVAAGVNHFTWILDLRRKSTGEDLYPLMRRTLAAIQEDKQGLSRKLLEVFGYFPGRSDSHVGEYIAYAYEFGLHGLNFDAYLEQEHKRWSYLKSVAENEAGWDQYESHHGDQSALSEDLRLDEFFAPRSWADTLAIPLIDAQVNHKRLHMPALNLLNHGAIDNLPADIFVETPSVVDGSGIYPVRMGPLRHPLAALIRRDVDQMELIVEAAVTGNRNLVLQAMLLDPVVDHIGNAERVLSAAVRVKIRDW